MSYRALVLCITMLAGCRQPEATPAQRALGGDAERGKAHIRAFGCGACHTIPGVRGADALMGPPLTAFAQRAYIAGRLTNTADNLVIWIVNPKSVDEQTAMPVLGVSPAQARDMAAYLYTLKSGGLGPPHLLPPSWLH